jgi:DNA-directed RNA polymerase specialized sigma24 family protein
MRNLCVPWDYPVSICIQLHYTFYSITRPESDLTISDAARRRDRKPIMAATAAYRLPTELNEERLEESNLQTLILRVQREDSSAAAQLSETITGAVRLMLRRSGVENPDAKINEVLFNAIDAIRACEVDSPKALLQFVRATVQKRKPPVAALSNSTIQYHQQVTKALARLPDRHREIIRRFYFLDQTPEFICIDMGITQTQFETGRASAKSALMNFRRGIRCSGLGVERHP